MPRLATKAEAGVAAEILGRAFARDPVLTAFFREDPVDTARLARYFELECRVGLADYGEAWLDDASGEDNARLYAPRLRAAGRDREIFEGVSVRPVWREPKS